jgi:hypothetical protein
MMTVPTSVPVANPTVHYARLYGALEGYAIVTPTGTTYFCDHDAHLYALTPDQAHALTDLGAVPAVERANVLQALARCEA